MTEFNRSDKTAVEIIKEAIDEGREVIPFLGAGLSAGSGFPLISEIRDYLCKVRFLIETGVYRHLLGEIGDQDETGKARDGGRPQDENIEARDAGSPQYNPARYIDCFGWPGLNQLDADLMSYIDSKSRDGEDTWWIDRLGHGDTSTGDPARNQWGKHRWRLKTAIHHVILKDIEFQDTTLARAISAQVRSLQLKPRVDWFRYLLDLAGGRRGLIDGLFTQLNARREPSLGHIMLAHLAREFGWRLLLTINFDTLLETALRRERMIPTVFEVARATQPPDPTLIMGSQLALLKLHGGSYDLRIGEPLDHSLDGATRENVFKCIPSDALLLVIGFSGDERRMMQLIEELVLRTARPQDPYPKNPVRLLWMHWEDVKGLPQTVTQLKEKLKAIGRRDEFCNERISDAGTFLFETYQHLTKTIPSGTQPYSTLPKHVLSSKGITQKTREAETAGKTEKQDDTETARAAQEAEASKQAQDAEIARLLTKPIHLFARASLKGGDWVGHAVKDYPWMPRQEMTWDDNLTSRQMSRFVSTLKDYHLIWIDLEDHHTVSGIAGEVIKRMRTFDPNLPDLVLPVDDDPANMYIEPQSVDLSLKTQAEPRPPFEKAVRYILRALKRGRYTLAFDSLEGFGREQTGHHGLPSEVKPERSDNLTKRHLYLIEFLKMLIKQAKDLDWYCCVSADEPTHRHIVPPENKRKNEDPLDKVREQIKNFCTELIKMSDAVEDVAIARPENVRRITDQALPSHTNLSKFCVILGHLDDAGKKARVFARGLEESGFVSRQEGCLEEAIESIVGDDPRLTPDDLAVFLMLSVFRRPRSLAAVHGVLKDFWSGGAGGAGEIGDVRFDEWLTGALTRLQSVGLLRPMDGGYFWILHHTHEWTYKLLTEPVRWQCARAPSESTAADGSLGDGDEFAGWLDDDWAPGKVRMRTAAGDGKPTVHRGEDRINRLIFLVGVHSRIAKFYYMDVFKRAHDIAGLYEYLYHRISSVKYLSTLRGILTRFEKDCEKDVLRPVRDRVMRMCKRDGIDILSPPRCELPLPDVVEACRNNYLRRLLNVLVRDEQAVLSRGTADTWLSWINRLEEDIKHLDDGQAPGAGQVAQNQHVGTPGLVRDEMKKLSHVRSELKWKLSELRVRLLREKGARALCVESLLGLMFAQCARCRRLVDEFYYRSETEAHRVAHTRLMDGWKHFREEYYKEKRGDGSRPATSVKRTIDTLITLCDLYFDAEVLGEVFSAYSDLAGVITQELSRFFWCFREACACLRHYPKCGDLVWGAQIETWLHKATNEWMTVVVEAIGDPDAAFYGIEREEDGRDSATRTQSP